MLTRRLRGLTLIEVLMVVTTAAMVLLVVLTLLMQVSKVWARTSVRVEPQASVMMAFKRMDRDIRQAMKINVTSNPSSWVTVYLPAKDATDEYRLPVLNSPPEGDTYSDTNLNGKYDAGEPFTDTDANGIYNPVDPRYQLVQGTPVSYFLGVKVAPDPDHANRWIARPDDGTSTEEELALFRAEGVLASGTFSNAQVLVDHVVNPLTIKDPSLLGPEILKRTLFTYAPFNDNGTPDNPEDDYPMPDTELIIITLIVKGTDQLGKTIYQPLSTEFCMRNLGS